MAVLTLTPYNAEAKLEFFRVADWLQKQDATDVARVHARKYIYIRDEPVQDVGVAQILRRRLTGIVSRSPSSSPPGQQPHSTSPVRSVDIWSGFYYLDLGEPPFNPKRGWVAGRLRPNQKPNDLVLSVSQDPNVMVRQTHAVFQLSDMGSFTVHSRANMATVNEETLADLDGPYYLQDTNAIMTFGYLKYRVAYSPFWGSDKYQPAAEKYLNLIGKQQNVLWKYFETPWGETPIRIGEWRISSSGTVATGGSGRVSIGSNSAGQVAALKRISISNSQSRYGVAARRDTIRKITHLAQKAGEDRVLLLLDIIDDDPSGSNRAVDTWFVLQPVVPETLVKTCKRWFQKDQMSKLKLVKTVMIEILGALQFLHSNRWMHGDLKPGNVGIRDPKADQLEIVLIDMDEATPVPSTGKVQCNPESGGTLGWISPEREMADYDESCDLWSLGLLAVWLINDGRHPWKFSVNPWQSWKRGRTLTESLPLLYEGFFVIPMLEQPNSKSQD
ncbi:Protein kinase-like domain protein [Cordyceps fumosorosea ARSEF 2679]|uniref:Protein kinase-like domain protein n=1 Tax=Cordyceps fumosorosea (strain ARSEF 2679) TaxID=1081104 RepID=A0A167MS19_CORFA|nr:Protein kinase-like domain protein [Cordyceps fumosorosea ARSEF 2679]OAA54692.1 Protein kinase-like domain protein [Cordyceps fumosorosea ARSEF 2679]